MRRKLSYRQSGRRRASFVYACSIAALMAYAVPRMALHHGLAGSFWVIWVLFAVPRIGRKPVLRVRSRCGTQSHAGGAGSCHSTRTVSEGKYNYARTQAVPSALI